MFNELGAMSSVQKYPVPEARKIALDRTRNLKMARSSHRYVRGSTLHFYEWLATLKSDSIPEGPAIWICGDCHNGNIGPVADNAGAIAIQIRDLDQTVIGNPVHDLLRLALSLASAARGSDLPGMTTALMLEAIMDGYENAFDADFDREGDVEPPKSVRLAIRESRAANWKTLAAARIGGPDPKIPIGSRFWPLSEEESAEIARLSETDEIKALATALRRRDDDAKIKLVDAAYWLKGCSSLGLLRYAALFSIHSRKSGLQFCLLDFKEATDPIAPPAANAEMPQNNAARVLEGARSLAPNLGERMRGAEFLGKPVFVRELLPQDLKIEIGGLSSSEAVKVARYMASVVGKAHNRQLDADARRLWLAELRRNRSKRFDAPTWLWKSVIALLGVHEEAYLAHCWRHALADRAREA